MRITEILDFGSPEFLHWLWSVPPIILLSLFGIRQKQKARERFHSTPVSPIYARRHKIQSGFLLIVSYLLVTFAIARPQFGEKQEPVQRQAVDIMLALDISTSMLAQDGEKQPRLRRAKRAMFALIEAMQGNRIGLLLFAEASFVVCPLTTDASTLKEFVAAVETEMLVHSGTQIGHAIETAVARFNHEDSLQNQEIDNGVFPLPRETQKIKKTTTSFSDDAKTRHRTNQPLRTPRERQKNRRVLILWTDGEDHGGTAVEAAKTAVSTGVHVYCIGVGTPGKPVPIPLAEGAGYKRNVSGQLVLTELGEETLREVAAQGQGRYYHETEISQQSGRLAGELAQLATRQFKVSPSNDGYAERFQLFVGIALLLLICETVTPLRSHRE